MSVSVGILYSSQRLIKLICDNLMTTNEILEQFTKIYVARTPYVLDLCRTCRWVEISPTGFLQVTNRGLEILEAQSITEKLRIQIKHYIYTLKPTWSKVLHYGRKEALHHFPQEIIQCFKEAELLGDYSLDNSIILWWDIVGAFSRSGVEEKKNSVGRRGELLSLQYEEKRLGVPPTWKSFESNFVGFDILSKVSKDDDSNLSIEVKATVSTTDNISFFITNNEWNTASLTKNYLFHIWSLAASSVLYILTPEIIELSIPSNKGNGKWESVKIEYKKNELESYKAKEGI
ncbi:protein NO VEIN domain-containing protein [Paenibacillus septentrionalis]|uniref:Protein NO VEIN domain-containing protein n=1 Tax=Paenibacillus septentrionalis TaxID=429342 RepID=A0ABW1V9G3_9BACL